MYKKHLYFAINILVILLFCLSLLLLYNIKKVKSLKNDLNQIKNSKEYKAVILCGTEDYWKIECLAEELNNDFKR